MKSKKRKKKKRCYWSAGGEEHVRKSAGGPPGLESYPWLTATKDRRTSEPQQPLGTEFFQQSFTDKSSAWLNLVKTQSEKTIHSSQTAEIQSCEQTVWSEVVKFQITH